MIGFIGSGNMAAAIVRGIVTSEDEAAQAILLSSATGVSARALAEETGAEALTEGDANLELVRRAGPGALIMLAVKPYQFAQVLAPLREELAAQSSVLVSLAAGLDLADLAAMVSPSQPIIRAMPNVNARVGAGVTALCANEATTEEQRAEAERVFTAVGEIFWLAERVFPAYTAIAGSAPAWAGLFVEALARGAVSKGLPKQQAVEIAAAMLLGSARTLLETSTTPTGLADLVSSPGGSTVAGTIELEAGGFTPAVVRAVRATADHAAGR